MKRKVSRERSRVSPYLFFSILSAAAILAISFYLGQNMRLDLAYLVAVNVTTTLIYAYDKSIAGSALLRVPEKTLHSLAFMGGSPGALVAQKIFRHKTVKESFQKIFWSIVALQVLLVIFITNFSKIKEELFCLI